MNSDLEITFKEGNVLCIGSHSSILLEMPRKIGQILSCLRSEIQTLDHQILSDNHYTATLCSYRIK
jgi:hypothetical protein